MTEWLRLVCNKYPQRTPNQCDYKLESGPVMVPKGSFVLVFLFGVTVAILTSLLPNLTVLLFDHSPQPQLTEQTAPLHLLLGHPAVKPQPCAADISPHDSQFSTAVQQASPDPNPDLVTEATAAAKLAKDMEQNGRVDKARKLLEHAVALASTNPDILNEYGEFLEQHQKDVVQAEHMYCQALTHSPRHSRALANRQRTLPLVEEIDQNYFNRIEHKRDRLIKIPEGHPGLRRMEKEMYFRHIHHTTAIEGNTFTLSQTRALVETRMAIGGKSVMEHNEILGMDSAMQFINNTLMHRIGSITLDDILQIHRRVLGHVDPIQGGVFRETQVYVGDYVPPSARDLGVLMEDFLDWLNAEETLNLNPIELAALAHYKLVYIHPFYDGNGRTSRLLMNLILMQAGYPPIIIKVGEKHLYFKHLQTANNGDIRPFIRFIAHCTERTLDEYLWSTTDQSGFVAEITSHKDDGRTIILEDFDSEENKTHP